MRALVATAAIAAFFCSFAPAVHAQNAQQQVMKSCNSSASAKKLSGAERKSYMADCLSSRVDEPKSRTAERKSRADEPKLTAQQQRMKDCNASARGMKGEARSDFIGSCLHGESGASRSASRRSEPRETTATAPREREPSRSTRSDGKDDSILGRWFDRDSRSTSGSRGEAASAREHRTETQARMNCGSDPVVWVNTDSRIYHFKDTQHYGRTKEGAYMCERDALSGGSRAARNEQRPAR